MAIRQLIEERSIPVTESGCWLWERATTRTGYGVMWHDGKVRYAHRLSAQHLNGEDVEGKVVCHRCDNPSCVNPSHLFVGDVKDNVRDMHDKGRARGMYERGSRNRNAKLTEDAVREILASGETYRTLAAKYGVDHSVISDVKNGKLWGHVK